MQVKLSNGASLWARRLGLYFSLCILVIIISDIVFSYSGFFHTTVDSARYMLNTLVGSEAAIIALVITMDLVAVQLAASSYSARVIDVFRRAPDLWILIGLYGIAIFYGLGVLKLTEAANPKLSNLANLETHISFSYYLGIFTFVALIPFIWNTLELLKPTTIINMLAEDITKQNIIASFKGIQEDPIQPIIDIVRGSLMKYDYETVRDVLRAIGYRTDSIFENEELEEKDEDRISEHLFTHLSKVGELAASKDDESSTIEVIDCIFSNGATAEVRKLEHALQNALESLAHVGVFTARKKFELATFYVVDYLGMLGETAARDNCTKASQQAAESLKEVLEAARENKIENAVRRGEKALKEISKASGKLGR